MSDVVIYSEGIVACSVCAPAVLTVEQVEDAVNAQSPTGIMSQWTHSADPTFRTGQPNPCPCESDPFRTHYLMEC